MRIVLPHSFNSSALAPIYRREFEALGHQTFTYEPASERRIVPLDLPDRVLQRVAPWIKEKVTSRQLEHLIDRCDPDVVLIFKGMEFTPSAIRALRRLGTKVVNYNADHPFAFSSRGSGNTNVARSVSLFDLYLTYSHRIQSELNTRYPSLRTGILPFGHDVSDGCYAELCHLHEVMKVSFVGNPDKHRAAEIKWLAKQGFPIDVYGFGWDRWLAGVRQVSCHGPVDNRRMLKVMRQYRVSLNLFRPHNIDSHNMRSFEVPAVGGLLVAPDSVEHRSFFNSGEEAIFFRNRDSLAEEVEQLLAARRVYAENVRKAARRRSVVSGYHYRDRAKQALVLLTGA